MTHAPDALRARILATLQSHLPIRGARLGFGLSTMSFYKGGLHPDDIHDALVVSPERGVYATFRLWVWSPPDGAGSGADAGMLESIVEQEVRLASARALDDARLEAYLEGWCLALERILTQPEPPEALVQAMPHDLVAPSALRLARPQSAEAFAQAFLGAKRRLGRFVGPGAT